MTITDQIIVRLNLTPGITAWQVSQKIGQSACTVSSIMYKLVLQGKLSRTHKFNRGRMAWHYTVVNNDRRRDSPPVG